MTEQYLRNRCNCDAVSNLRAVIDLGQVGNLIVVAGRVGVGDILSCQIQQLLIDL